VTLSLVLAFVWVVAAAITAMMPMRRQYLPGVSLLVLSPPLLIFVGYENGWWVALIALLAAISMFRNPLRYLVRRALGKPVTLPPELREPQSKDTAS